MHLIQVLPITSASELLLDPRWSEESSQRVALEALTRVAPVISSGFRAYLYLLQAVNDPQSAWDNVSCSG